MEDTDAEQIGMSDTGGGGSAAQARVGRSRLDCRCQSLTGTARRPGNVPSCEGSRTKCESVC